MSGGKAELRSHALAIRVAKLRAEGISVKETADITRVDRDRVRTLQLLGERLLQKDA